MRSTNYNILFVIVIIIINIICIIFYLYFVYCCDNDFFLFIYQNKKGPNRFVGEKTQKYIVHIGAHVLITNENFRGRKVVKGLFFFILLFFRSLMCIHHYSSHHEHVPLPGPIVGGV